MLIVEYRSWVYWCTLYTSSNLGVYLKFFIKKKNVYGLPRWLISIESACR